MNGPGLGDVARLLLTLLAVVGGLAALAWLARRQQAGSRSPLRVLCRVGVAKGASLAIVAAGQRRLLVSTGERGVSLLAELEAEEVDAMFAQETSTDGFIGAQRRTGPGTGLVKKLQLMTLRSSLPRSPRGPDR